MLYRIASILLLLFDVGHTLGFRQSDPKWGVDALLASMRSIHFDARGSATRVEDQVSLSNCGAEGRAAPTSMPTAAARPPSHEAKRIRSLCASVGAGMP